VNLISIGQTTPPLRFFSKLVKNHLLSNRFPRLKPEEKMLDYPIKWVKTNISVLMAKPPNLDLAQGFRLAL
jgi:hypothetical protein